MSLAIILSILKRFWPIGAILAVIGAGYLAIHHLESEAYARGVQSVQATLVEAQNRANENARLLEQQMNKTSTQVANKEAAQQQELTIKVKPQEDALNAQIHNDPNAGCALSDGVRKSLQTDRTTINAAITASATK